LIEYVSKKPNHNLTLTAGNGARIMRNQREIDKHVLYACPTCGGRSIEEIYKDHMLRIACATCGATTPEIWTESGDVSAAMIAAVGIWNQREKIRPP